jgi:proline dehydrogenase
MSERELLRALLVLRVCSVQALVRNADSLLRVVERIAGRRFTMALLRRSFFGHFCAGESAEDTKATVHKLAKCNVNAIMDYAAEADVAQTKSAADKLRGDVHHRKDGVVSARTYEYEDERGCEANTALILESINNAAYAGGDQFVAMKLTAIAKPELLEKISSVLRAIKNLWINEFGSSVAATAVDAERFRKFIASIGVSMSADEVDQLFRQIDKNHDGNIDYIEWTRLLSTTSLLTRRFFVADGYDLGLLKAVTRRGAPNYFTSLLPLLGEDETELVDRAVARLDTICAAAAAKRVRLMIDAEQTYLQPAIDHFARRMQLTYNKDGPFVFNTYQAYLKSAKTHLATDIERCRRLGVCFAGKLVRGAYMVGERKRAADLGLNSPICDTIEETHENYNSCIDIFLRTRRPGSRASLMVASHNRASIEHCVTFMQKLGVDRANGGIYFGQLLGMADFLTFPLGLAGYKVYKYVPYGPIHEVVPYLLRRAQENSGALSNAPFERSLLWSELTRRWRSRVGR